MTLTLLLFHPAESGAGEPLAVIIGGASSILTFAVADAVTPALSVAVPCTAWLAPCEVTVTGPGQLWIPTLASLQVNVTVTLELFQPAAFGAGATVAVITGGGGKDIAALVLAVPVTALPSSTVSVTVNVPAEEYVCVGATPVAVDPSPKFQW